MLNSLRLPRLVARDNYCAVAPYYGVRYSRVLKKALLAISVFAIIGIVALVTFIQIYLATTKFSIENISPNTVQVVAKWGDKQKDIGELKVRSIVMFEVNDEAAMSFDILYPDGKIETTDAVYFTSGTSVYVQINSEGVDVNADT